MKNRITITLPKLGESIVNATVVQWFKKIGDFVELDEPLLEVATDKVNSEIPSPCAGTVQEVLAFPAQQVQVGEPLAVVSTCAASEHTCSEPQEQETKSSFTSSTEAESFLSPAVLRLLKEKKISASEMEKIPHSGAGGRLTKQDVENYHPCVAGSNETERIPMGTLRKAIAENMVRSFYEAPHASLATEVDVTAIMKTIQEHKISFMQRHKVKLTITAFVARAIACAVKEFPLINASLEEDTIVMKHFVHLGIAVSVEQGVMVPVVHNCQQLSFVEIAKNIATLAEKARTHQLQPNDVQGGTITMTNFGMTGTMIGIPIIRFPEVAIVGLGAVVKKVMPMPDDSIAIRSVVWVSLTFDHRVLDGLYGCGFLHALKKKLEEDLSIE